MLMSVVLVFTLAFTYRYASRLGSATQNRQVDTVKLVGRHFRMTQSKEPFLRKARVTFYMKKFQCQKLISVMEAEHGLNLNKGQ